MPQPLTPVSDVLTAYKTCEFVTLSKDGTPLAWPTSGITRPDGTFLLTTSVSYPQKAFNIRRDGRVALLFSEPYASGVEHPEQVLVTGEATCPDEIHTDPSGDLGDFWARIFTLQPGSTKYLDWPINRLTDFYFFRLMIRITPSSVETRPLPPAAPPAESARVGGEVLAAYPTAVLAARDDTGAPLLIRTNVVSTPSGYSVAVPADLPVTAGPASLLVHRHDDKLDKLHSASVVGTLAPSTDGSWLLTPTRLIEPGTRHKGKVSDQIKLIRGLRAATDRYLTRRGLTRPSVPWAAYRKIRAALPK
ncbi:pyridoxamine 5'-phosphate oxidase family protein [Actinoplanes sp. NPDC000266]